MHFVHEKGEKYSRLPHQQRITKNRQSQKRTGLVLKVQKKKKYAECSSLHLQSQITLLFFLMKRLLDMDLTSKPNLQLLIIII